MLHALRDSLNQGAATAMQGAAHSLKSFSADLGALDLANLCTDLEASVREDRLTGAREILDEIEKIYPAVCAALAAECREHVA